MSFMQAKETGDLLSLIAAAIEQLRQSIELFETASQTEGIFCLSTVIREIGTYMTHAQDDPLLRLAHIDASSLAADLTLIKADLAAVIDQVEGSAPS
jgi:hypothetical protein